MQLPLLPHKGYTVTCNLSEEEVQGKIRRVFTSLTDRSILRLFTRSKISYAPGEPHTFTIKKTFLAPAEKVYNVKIIGNATINSGDHQSQILVDYKADNKLLKLMMMLFITVSLFACIGVFYSLLDRSFTTDDLPVLIISLTPLIVALLIRTVLARWIANFHRQLVNALKA